MMDEHVKHNVNDQIVKRREKLQYKNDENIQIDWTKFSMGRTESLAP